MANEDRLMFLETICAAKENLYISWVGQSEKTAEELDPSSVVVMLLENLKNQYGIDDIIKKHPLQPFSRKYFNGDLETYDNRWIINPENSVNLGSDIWEWKINNDEIKERGDVNDLLRALSDAPKYFLRTVCNIELPEDIEPLDNIEPLTVKKGLAEWILADKILKNDDCAGEIKVSKLRCELPSGKFANRIINEIVNAAEKLKAKAKNEKKDTYWIYPSNDNGKYRLKHWLYHLDLNLNKFENQNTKMFLKDIEPIELKGMPKEKAKEILDDLWKLIQELETRMLPIFPSAAWKYKESGKMEDVEKDIFGDGHKEGIAKYSQYAKMAIGKAQSFKDSGIEIEEFKKYSIDLFKEYDNYEIGGK
jgi:exonuclease V gamma subunit